MSNNPETKDTKKRLNFGLLVTVAILVTGVVVIAFVMLRSFPLPIDESEPPVAESGENAEIEETADKPEAIGGVQDKKDSGQQQC